MIDKNKGRYVAVHENPIVLCSYGDTPADAFKQMAKLIKEQDCQYVTAVNTSFDEEVHYVTVYI